MFDTPSLKLQNKNRFELAFPTCDASLRGPLGRSSYLALLPMSEMVSGSRPK